MIKSDPLAKLREYSDYVAHGIYLVPISPCRKTGLPTKAPVTSGWNLEQNIVKSEAQINEAWLAQNWNVGIVLLQSNIVSFDIDDLEKTRQIFADILDFDLDELLNAPDAVRITGKPGRAKLLYRVPDDLHHLTTQQLAFGKESIFEIRYQSTGGKTHQDVLPPSIHPDTGKPYEWIGDWTNIPEVPQIFADLWANWGDVKPAILELDPTYEPPPTRPDRPPRALQEVRQAAHSPRQSIRHSRCRDTDRRGWQNARVFP